MEFTTAIGLVSNILQFIELTTKVVRISNQLRHDAASSENQDHQVIATHLEGLAKGIKDSIIQTSTTASSEDKALQSVVDRCRGLANELLDRLKRCGIQPNQNVSRLRRTKLAFKTIWNKKEIEEISSRLQLLRSEVNLHYTVQIKAQLNLVQVRQSTTDDVQAVQRRLDNLGPLIDSLKNDIDVIAKNQRSEIMTPIVELRAENSRMYTQAMQQALASQVMLTEKLDDLQTSGAAVNTKLENIQTQQSETFESIAQVRVENSAFFAKAMQQVSLGDESGVSLQNVIRPLFEGYIEIALAEMKKEYRSTARSEADHLLKDLLPALHELQYCQGAIQEHPANVVNENEAEIRQTNSELWSPSTDLRNSESLDGQSPYRLKKKRVSVIYNRTWSRKTSLGRFRLTVRERLRFDSFGRVAKLHELTAQFVPSPRWFAASYSIIYESKFDARGSPEFGLRFKIRGILEDDHEVFRAIRSGDISTLQSMLSQKLISPSHTDEDGFSLLDMAVLSGKLDICKVLVQSGADINACNRLDLSPLSIAILPLYSCTKQHGQDIVHYLLGLPGIEIDFLWENVYFTYFLASNLHKLPREALPKIQEWVSICRFVELDFNIPGNPFLNSIIWKFSLHDSNQLVDRMVLFNIIIQQGIGHDQSTDPASIIPVACAAFEMAKKFRNMVDAPPDDTECTSKYRGYVIAPHIAEIFEFLEQVISKGIAERPGCIFDSYDGETISDMLRIKDWEHAWEEILEEHGFDVRWVYEENERRKRVITGETSTHEISLGVDVSALRDVKRRKGYGNSDE